MKITVVSDVHLNSPSSEIEAFTWFISNLQTDLLILNGDIYDLFISPPKYDIFQNISRNPNIKKWIYIRGNHDQDIEKYFNIKTEDRFEIGNLFITHGHQYDDIGNKANIIVAKLRYYIEWFFHINLKLLFMFFFGKQIREKLLKVQDKAIESNPDKFVIIGHTHIPKNEYKVYNCGAFVDKITTFMEINYHEGAISTELVELKRG